MTCLRCGRTVPDQLLLCPDCRTPKKRQCDANSALTPEERLQKQVASLEKRTSRQKRRMLFLVLACLLSIALLGHAVHTLMKQNDRISTLNTKVNSQEAAIAKMQSELTQANLTVEAQREKLLEAENTIAEYHRSSAWNP